MARRLIGLDVGTNAVTVAEIEPGEPPLLRAFGQVALPPDAMREGEITDPAAVSAAIKRLWREIGLGKTPVRVGLASPRVIVRPVELPAMSEDDLAGALRFQAQELIPIPLDEAVVDFQVLETIATVAPDADAPSDAAPPPMNRVLLAAAHRDAVSRLVATVESAGVKVSAVDLVPLALIRSLGRMPGVNAGSAEAIVSLGAGVSVVVVHQSGLPRFVRILGIGGRVLTDAIAEELDVASDTAEALKRQSAAVDDALAIRARTAMERPLAELLEEVRGSVDFYRSQPDAAALERVILTGGTSRLTGVRERLAQLVGLPVEDANPREYLRVGDIGFPGDEIASLDPFLPVPVGLALGGTGAGRRINLLPSGGGRSEDVRRLGLVGAAAAAVLVLGLGYLAVGKQNQVSDEKKKLETQQQTNNALQAKIDALASAATTKNQADLTRAKVVGVLADDVSWSHLLQDIARTMPSDVWLTAFQGTVTRVVPVAPVTPAPTTGSGESTTTSSSTTTTAAPTTGTPTTPTPAGGILTGTINFTAVGLDYPSVSAWLTRLAAIPAFSDLWVPSAAESAINERKIVNFSSTATLNPNAKSTRAEKFGRAQ